MSNAAPAITIPDDLTSCHALIEQLAGTINEQANKIESLDREKQDLQLAYTALLQQAFRRRSERYLEDPSQLVLDFGDSDDVSDAADGLQQAVEEAEQTISQHTRRAPRKTRNEKFPEHIPRRVVVVDVPDEMKDSPLYGPSKVIGYDAVEKLVLERPKLYVLETRYVKRVFETSPEQGVMSPERPTGLVEGDRYDTSVAAEVITGKYGYHLPIYRQQDCFAGSGWTPSRSTLLNLLVAAAFVIRPLHESDLQR